MDKIECSICGKKDDIGMFCKGKFNKDGSRGICKECKSRLNKEYNQKYKKEISARRSKSWRENPEIRINSRRWQENLRTGMDATEYAKDKSCEICGITNNSHISKYNTRLHVHHKNDDGRHNINQGIEPNHKDLQVLCVSCHAIESNKNKDYTHMGHKVWKVRRERHGDNGLKKGENK